MIYTALHVSTQMDHLQGDSCEKEIRLSISKIFKFKTLCRITVIYKYILNLLHTNECTDML